MNNYDLLIRNARLTVMNNYDLLIRNARLTGVKAQVDITCKNGKIVEIADDIKANATEQLDAGGMLLSPPFVDCHFHLDSTLSFGQPRLNQSGTLLEGIEIWGELKRMQSKAQIIERALTLCRWSIAQGVLAIRSHVDVSDPKLTTVEALLEVKQQMADYIDIQLVAFPQDGFLRDAGAAKRLTQALEMGVEIVGGIPHFERTAAAGAESIDALCKLASQRGLAVDMHCDENDDPNSRYIETLAEATIRYGLQGKVAGSHLTSMHSMDNYYVSKLLPLIAEARIAVIPNPLINITLQGRHDSYPKRRGLTRIKELWDAEIAVAFGHDCVLDPWYSFGSHDMLAVANMAIHVGQLTTPELISKSYDAVTTDAAGIFGLADYGIAVGNNADFVLLQALDTNDALRLQAKRLAVIRRGQIISSCAVSMPTVKLGGKEYTVDFQLPKNN